MAKVLQVTAGIPRYKDLSTSVYDEVLTVGGTIAAGTSVTLPASGNYSGDELSLFLNGQRLHHVEDYTYVGAPPRTQVSFLFDLVVGDLVLFRKEL